MQSKFGDLQLNFTDPDSGRRYQVQPDGFRVGPTLRVIQENLSQQSGSVLHPRWKTGVTAAITLEYWLCEELVPDDQRFPGEIRLPACGTDLLAMDDQLSLWLNSMWNLTDGDGQRYRWTGADGVQRMLTNVELLAWLDPSFAPPWTSVTFALESEFPYAISFTQQTVTIDAGDTADVTNAGTADVWPVMKVNAVGGGCTAFTITNEYTGELVSFDSTRPGAAAIPSGHYVEIDFFKGTIFLDGNSTDYIPGVVPTTTDFFQIYALGGTANTISFDGTGGAPTVDVLWNDAWA